MTKRYGRAMHRARKRQRVRRELDNYLAGVAKRAVEYLTGRIEQAILTGQLDVGSDRIPAWVFAESPGRDPIFDLQVWTAAVKRAFAEVV